MSEVKIMGQGVNTLLLNFCYAGKQFRYSVAHAAESTCDGSLVYRAFGVRLTSGEGGCFMSKLKVPARV